MSILYDDLPVVYGTGEILHDEKTNWTDLKLKSEAVATAMGEEITDYWIKRSEKVLDCGAVLHFAVSKNSMRLIKAFFCRDRMCPSCQKRRSLMIFHQVKSVCISIQKEQPTIKYLMLTLTVPNVKASELKETISHMMKSWGKLIKRKEFKTSIKGWFRALEITYNGERDDYHPHFHILLSVNSGYFKKNYITQNRWLELWQESTKNFNITQVDVRRVKPNPKKAGSTDVESAVAEVAKYATKPSNYICKHPISGYMAHGKVVRELGLSIASTRLIAFGGIMKEHLEKLSLKDVEDDDSDMINVSGESDQIDAVMVQIFRWNIGFKQYIG